MDIKNALKSVLTAALCAAVTSCASVQPVPFSGLASAAYLAPNAGDESGRIPYRYDSRTNLAGYRQIMIDPVTIYRGADQQFGNMSEADKADLARYMQSAFADQLKPRFVLVNSPAPDTLRLKLTLAGAATNTAVISPFTHLDLTGNLVNVVQAVRGREGMIAGSVTYAVEIFDAPTNRLLSAYVTKQYPGAMNIAASLGSLAAAKTGIDKGADRLVAELK